MAETPVFKCAHQFCACESVSFNISLGPDGTLVIGDCSACGHAYNEHKPPVAEIGKDRQATDDASPVTPPKTRPGASGHGHDVRSTPIKICSLSGVTVNTSGKVARRSAGRGRLESLAMPERSRSASEVRESLLQQLDGAIYFDVVGVEEHFFGKQVGEPDDADRMHVDQAGAVGGEAIAAAAPAPSDALYVPWLVGRLRALGATPNGAVWGDTRYTTIPSGFSTSRRPDFCLLLPSAAATRLWDSVAVVGEHQSAGSTETQAVLQLADYASQMFAHQPLCLRVHAVLSYLDHRRLRLFLFDRGGAVASRLLYADEQTLSRLATMRAPQPQSLAAAVHMPIRVGDVLCRRPGIVCRGTFCAMAHADAGEPIAGIADGGVLVKLSWRSAGRINEGALLREAASRGVVGVAEYVFHTDIVDLTELRRGLSATMANLFAIARPAPAPATPAGTGGMASNGATREGDNTGSRASGSRGPSGNPPAPPAAAPDPASPMQLHNRIFACVAMSTVGIPIAHCVHARQVGNALLGALIGHASLFFTGGILHRDVSSANVLYSKSAIAIARGRATPAAGPDPLPTTLASLHGFLIDLDYAIHYPPVEGMGSGAPHRTGTLPFMSIGVLMAEPHVYAHDLESFLYVLIWVCSGGGQTLSRWATGTVDTISTWKLGQMMTPVKFEQLLSGFEPGFKGGLQRVATEWREVLFRVESGGGGGAGNEDAMYKTSAANPGWVKRGLGEWQAFVRMRDVLWQVMNEEGWVEAV